MTEHGNVETENEIYEIKGYDYDTTVWSHHHNPRTVANNPAGEITLNMGITGPHYTIGAACAAGNAGLIQGAQMLRLGECDVALAGGVSESIRTFGIFAGFASQGALATHDDPDEGLAAVRRGPQRHRRRRRRLPVRARAVRRRQGARREDLRRARRLRDEQRRQRLRAAQSRAAGRSAWSWRCERAGSAPDEIDLVSTHATGTASGDVQECVALRQVFGDGAQHVRSTTPRASSATRWGRPGRLELAGNLPAFDDGVCHATINVDRLDPECALPGLVRQRAARAAKRPTISSTTRLVCWGSIRS